MRYAFGPVAVELALQERIHRRIQVEREPGRARDSQPPVEVEAARAVHVEFHLRAAECEWRGGIGLVPTQTLLGISQLAFPEMMIEIDVTAVAHE